MLQTFSQSRLFLPLNRVEFSFLRVLWLGYLSIVRQEDGINKTGYNKVRTDDERRNNSFR